MHSVRFFIFPHWVLGQCENLISERFLSMPARRSRCCSAGLFSVRAPLGDVYLHNVANLRCETVPSGNACANIGCEALPSPTPARCQGQGAWRDVKHDIVIHRESRHPSCNRDSEYISTRAGHAAPVREWGAWHCAMLGGARARAWVVRRRFASATKSFNEHQPSTLHRVRFFIFPHCWLTD